MFDQRNNNPQAVKYLALCGVVVVLLAAVGFYGMSAKWQTGDDTVQPVSVAATGNAEINTSQKKEQNDIPQNQSIPKDINGSIPSAANEVKPAETEKPKPEVPVLADRQPKAEPTPESVEKNTEPPASTPKNEVGTVEAKPQTEPPKVQPTAKPMDIAVKIPKAEVTSQAKFYPCKIDNITMEVIAVKAGDGSIRTALNTCQVCFDSGKGYYVQIGEYLVCQNCKNKFHIDQVEKVKGGCNPVPVLQEDKTDLGDSIAISKDFLASQKEYFKKWKK